MKEDLINPLHVFFLSEMSINTKFKLPLTSLHARLLFVDNINTSSTFNDLRISVSFFKIFYWTYNFHRKQFQKIRNTQWKEFTITKVSSPLKFVQQSEFLIKPDGGHGWDWTNDPHDVNVMLFHWATCPNIIF